MIASCFDQTAVSLTDPNGQEFQFPHSFLKFRPSFLNVPHFFQIFLVGAILVGAIILQVDGSEIFTNYAQVAAHHAV